MYDNFVYHEPQSNRETLDRSDKMRCLNIWSMIICCSEWDCFIVTGSERSKTENVFLQTGSYALRSCGQWQEFQDLLIIDAINESDEIIRKKMEWKWEIHRTCSYAELLLFFVLLRIAHIADFSVHSFPLHKLLHFKYSNQNCRSSNASKLGLSFHAFTVPHTWLSNIPTGICRYAYLYKPYVIPIVSHVIWYLCTIYFEC